MFSYWQGAHEDVSEKVAKGAFITVLGGPAFALKCLNSGVPQHPTLREISVALLHHFQHVNFEASERVECMRSYVLQSQKQAEKCIFGAKFDNHLRDRLNVCINDYRRRCSWKSDQLYHLCGRPMRNLKNRHSRGAARHKCHNGESNQANAESFLFLGLVIQYQ